MSLGLGVVLVTIAVPLQLGGPWISVAWAAEAAVLMWLAATLRVPRLREASIGVFLIFAIWLIGVETPVAVGEGGRPFVNPGFLPYLFGAVSASLIAYILRRSRPYDPRTRTVLSTVFVTAANGILTLSVPLEVPGEWISITWAAQAVVLVWLSRRLGLHEMRFAGLGVLGLAILRSLLLAGLANPHEVHLPFVDQFLPVANLRFVAFASAVAAALGITRLMRQNSGSLFSWEREYVPRGLIAAANVVALWGLSVEVIAFVDDGSISFTSETARAVKSVSLSILWAAYGSVVLAAGLLKGQRAVRVGGLLILAVPVGKLFLVDAFQLDQVYRVIAFVGLGAMLLVGGFLYQRFSAEVKSFFLEDGHASS